MKFSRPTFLDRSLFQGLCIAAIAGVSILRSMDPADPPRFDGAGYSVLGLSLLSGQGYRSIDRPDSPRHAHFPPGYPFALATLWSLTGKSAAAAHRFSAVCSVSAVILAWLWFRKIFSRPTAFLCGLSLAVNWTWARNGGSIQSEPLFLLLSQLAVLATLAAAKSRKVSAAIGSGVLFGLCILTRQVALALVGALCLDLALRQIDWNSLSSHNAIREEDVDPARPAQMRTRTAMIALATCLCVILPWVIWSAIVAEHTQAGLLTQGSLPERVAGLAVFYFQRIPDQLVGPFVEVGTVFRSRPSLALALNIWAIAATTVIVLGWFCFFRNPRRRFAGLVPVATLGLLLLWPFTEAGRFLIPLVPFLIVGATEGLARVLRRFPKRFDYRRRAAAFVLAGSIPYAAYGFVSDRSKALRETHLPLDQACAWIADHADRPGPILSRHPGEVYWQTGRKGYAAEREDVETTLSSLKIAYLLIDADRYADAAASPLSAYVRDHPEGVREVWKNVDPRGSSIAIFEVIQSTGGSNRRLP